MCLTTCPGNRGYLRLDLLTLELIGTLFSELQVRPTVHAAASSRISTCTPTRAAVSAVLSPVCVIHKILFVLLKDSLSATVLPVDSRLLQDLKECAFRQIASVKGNGHSTFGHRVVVESMAPGRVVQDETVSFDEGDDLLRRQRRQLRHAERAACLPGAPSRRESVPRVSSGSADTRRSRRTPSSALP